jgi:hypothetical protein
MIVQARIRTKGGIKGTKGKALMTEISTTQSREAEKMMRKKRRKRADVERV